MEQRVRIQEVSLPHLARRAVEQNEPILIELEEGPPVVLLSYEKYLRLRTVAQEAEQWEEALERLLKVGAAIRMARNGKPLPSPEEVIRETREERLVQLTGLR